MKKSKRLVGLLALLLLICLGSLTVSAEPSNYTGETRREFTSGTFTSKEGNSIPWSFVNAWYSGDYYDTYRTILIEGSGSMPDLAPEYCSSYNWKPVAPWRTDSEYGMSNTAYLFVDEGITAIGEYNFMGLGGLMFVTLPESLTSIGDYAFSGCCNLISINIPSSVTYIGPKAFEQAVGGTTIYCESGSYAYKYAMEYGISVSLTDKSACETNGHTWGSWQTVSAATTAAPEKQSRTCSVCRTTETRNYGNKLSASVKVSSITVTGSKKTLLAGKKMTLNAGVYPSNASNTAVTWKSSSKKYATVTSSGVVTAKAAGAGKYVTITATAKDGSGVKGTYRFKIKGAVKKIRLSVSSKTVKAGKKVTVKAKVTVGTGGSKALKWTSSNKAYATVNSKGVVTAKKAGKGHKVTITARAKDGSGKKASITLKIR